VGSDFNITCEVRNIARAAIGHPHEGQHDEGQHAPVWRYLYAHRFENDASLKALRAFHTAELYFLFGNFNPVSPPNLGVDYTPTPDELAFSNALTGYWTRFAAKGNPNGSGAFHWPHYSAHDLILKLDVAPTRLHGYHNPQCDFLSPIVETFCSENICSP
jgi:carboxylesterase type B